MKKTIEVNGIRFSAEEVESVTIKRNGRTICINALEDKSPRVSGFDIANKPKEAS